MQSAIYLNAAGSLAAETRMDVVSNNLANVSTPGFRRQFAVFQARMNEGWEPPKLEPSWDPTLNDLAGGLFVHEVTYSNAPGPVQATDQPFDLGIEGEGWFSIERGGETLFTRAGNFARGEDGTILTADGQGKLLDQEGKSIQVPSGGRFVVERDGSVWVNEKRLAQISLRGSLDYRQFHPTGDNLYRYQGEGMPEVSEGRVQQGYLERSSVEPVVEMVNMIRTHRAYEANQQMIRQQDQALGRTVNDIARVS